MASRKILHGVHASGGGIPEIAGLGHFVMCPSKLVRRRFYWNLLFDFNTVPILHPPVCSLVWGKDSYAQFWINSQVLRAALDQS
jgi:hypothetical protein